MRTSPIRVVLTRPSDAERERVVRVLRDNVAIGRLSQDTFLGRMELALTAQARHQLSALVEDLPGRPARWLPLWLSKLAVKTADFLHRAVGRPEFQQPAPARFTAMLLPEPGLTSLRIGRALDAGLRLNDDTVSRNHAEFVEADGVWMLRDLGSMNGTFVNGRRVAGMTVVRPGDILRFGRLVFRLVAR